MPITVLAQLRANAEAADALLAVLREHLPDTRRFDGCLALGVIRDLDDPAVVTLVEEWESRDDHRSYLAWRAEQNVLGPLMGPLLAGPPAITYHVQLPEVHWG